MPLLLAVACAAAVLVLALIPAGAGAIIVHLRSGKALSFRPLRHAHALSPLDEVKPFNLDYSGGPVMASNTNYLVYWQPEKAPEYPTGYKTGIDRYFQDLAHDSGGTANVDSVAAQYNDAAGEHSSYSSAYGGELVDTHAYPKNGCTRATTCLTDAQLQNELTKFVKEKGLPTDLTHEYFMLTPPGVEGCFEGGEAFECSAGAEEGTQAYCAYHGNIPIEGGGELIYADDPYVAGNFGCEEGVSPNESPSDGELQGGLSHEHVESLTDPEPNNAWTDLFGGAEIGDKCDESSGAAVGHAPDGAPYNQVINNHFYWYQEEWSNQGRHCLQRLTFAGEAPQARFGITGGSGNEVHLDGSASVATGGVAHYDWQPNDPAEGPTTESSAPTLSRKFTKKGTFDVALAVFASDGTSAGTACTVTVPIADELPTATYTAPAETVPLGTAVHFDGTASGDEDGTIKSYTWSFGDGSPAVSGATPAHAFAADGSYKVKLTVVDSNCMESTVTHTVNVDEGPSAAIAVTSLTPVAGSPASFEAKASDPDGTITAYAWSFGDGSPSSTEANPAHTYAEGGTYEVTLKVTDSSGLTATATAKVTVHAADELPTAEFKAPGEAGAGTPLHFDGSSSSDPDGAIASYAWSFGDGSESSEAAPSHTYAAAGTYEVTLTVFDSAGLANRLTRTVEVDELPTVTIAINTPSPAAGSPVALEGKAADVDGKIESYSWGFGDGSPPSTVAAPSHTYAAPGSYEVTLTVRDSAGLQASTTRTVNVASASPSPGPILNGGPFGGEGLKPPPPPGEKASPTGTLALLGSTLPVHGGQATAKLSCTGTAPACVGRVVLSVLTRLRVHGHLRTRALTLATASFSIPAGHSATIKLVLSAAARSRLRTRHGHMPARLILVRTAPAPGLTQESRVRLARH